MKGNESTPQGTPPGINQPLSLHKEKKFIFSHKRKKFNFCKPALLNIESLPVRVRFTFMFFSCYSKVLAHTTII